MEWKIACEFSSANFLHFAIFKKPRYYLLYTLFFFYRISSMTWIVNFLFQIYDISVIITLWTFLVIFLVYCLSCSHIFVIRLELNIDMLYGWCTIIINYVRIFIFIKYFTWESNKIYFFCCAMNILNIDYFELNRSV